MIHFDLPESMTPKEKEAFMKAFVGKAKKPHPDRPLPFKCRILDDKPEEVRNELSGGSCMLEPDAIAVYDMIKGAEMFNDFEIVRKGCDWFKKYFPKEYMVLLD